MHVTTSEMSWAELEYTRDDVNRAAVRLLDDTLDWQAKAETYEIVNNWRAVHSCPLLSTRMTLTGRALAQDPKAIISQRIKRIPAIRLKLRENHARGMEMKLTQMHDVGGCRAVVSDSPKAEALSEVYRSATAKNALRGGIFHRKYDYIASPKETGYRSIHLVYRYHSESKKLECYNGLKIEIQIRSRLQHYWATAVETVDFYTGQALKSNIGDLPWKRFFVLVANEFARLERRPLVPGAPESELESKNELRQYGNQITALEGFQTATQVVAQKAAANKGAPFFLLALNLQKRTIKTVAFAEDEATQAEDEYIKLEANSDPQNIQTVLVSVASVTALRKAYPSFYLDISTFVHLLKKILAA